MNNHFRVSSLYGLQTKGALPRGEAALAGHARKKFTNIARRGARRTGSKGKDFPELWLLKPFLSPLSCQKKLFFTGFCCRHIILTVLMKTKIISV